MFLKINKLFELLIEELLLDPVVFFGAALALIGFLGLCAIVLYLAFTYLSTLTAGAITFGVMLIFGMMMVSA